MLRELIARIMIPDYPGNERWADNRYCFNEDFYKVSEPEQFYLMLEQARKLHPKEFESFDETKNAQEQLQRMILESSFWFGSNSSFAYSELLEGFLTFGVRKLAFNHCYARTYALRFRSMAQLFLAYYMEHVHYLRWNGKTWKDTGRGRQD